MFKKKVDFFIKANPGTTINEILEMIVMIKKAHPDAKISAEVEV